MSTRVLALDWGLKKTGVAVGEPGFPAQPLLAIDSTTRQKLLDEVGNLCLEHGVKTILIGLPPHPQNAQKVKKIKELLEDKGYKVVLWEETLTSIKAQNQLRQSAHSKKSIAKHIHSTAAALMLEEYLGT
ncbi:MAG: Holliday junction resolvase RuvX [bacterium]